MYNTGTKSTVRCGKIDAHVTTKKNTNYRLQRVTNCSMPFLCKMRNCSIFPTGNCCVIKLVSRQKKLTLFPEKSMIERKKKYNAYKSIKVISKSGQNLQQCTVTL